MQLELKKIPSQVYEGKMALRYGFWTPTGEIKTKLKFTYHFDDSWFNDGICLSVHTMEANKIDYKNDLLVVLEDNNIKYQTKTTGPNKWIIISKGDFIKRKTKRK